ncbi:hypothetical protein [Mesorhizobium sp.]|uniref:hypothetical protein n=1 Tax=Mesorhizobium sp. TaxID=1871066 RepID=UPI00120C8828|nr:hypothetical protein [Mesorhizobium sp.]TIM04310.1 MAG: hypothetical protein E5Y62_32475 [Mesorhizobium sp.]
MNDWPVLADLHEELADEAGHTNQKAAGWLRRMAAPGMVKNTVLDNGKRRTVVHRNALPLVDMWVARRAETRAPREQLGDLCRHLARTTEVFKPIGRAA